MGMAPQGERVDRSGGGLEIPELGFEWEDSVTA
jgi:hypothetical protein